MPDTTCSIDGCPKPSSARGWCKMHHTRYLRHGHPLSLKPRASIRDRVEAKIEKTGGDCWLWRGAHDASGYAVLRTADANLRVGRQMYSWHHGDIPEGMFVDHVCWNRGCVNPDHLRLATPKQNTENASGLRLDNTSGFRGVYRNGRRWAARVKHGGAAYNLGTFDTPEEAGEVAREARLRLFTHNNLDRL